MKKQSQGITFLEIFFVLIFVGLAMSLFPGCIRHLPGPVPSPTPIVEPLPSITPAQNKVPSIKYEPITAYDSEKSFIKAGETQANAVLASDCFKSQVMSAKFIENKGMTNAQIFKKFLDASPFKVGIKMFTGGWYEKINHTVAYEGNPIRMNRNYVSSAAYVGGTSLHEAFGHGLDFRHDTDHSYSSRTIPYTLNRIFDYCSKVLGYKVVY